MNKPEREAVAITPEMIEAGRKAIADERARVGMQYPDTLAVLVYRAMFDRRPATPSPARGGLEAVREALRGLLDHVDRETCTHEDTHRGGFIWTICDRCGRKWADDEGGFVPYSDPPADARARIVCDAAPATPAATGGKAVAWMTWTAMLDAAGGENG